MRVPVKSSKKVEENLNDFRPTPVLPLRKLNTLSNRVCCLLLSFKERPPARLALLVFYTPGIGLRSFLTNYLSSRAITLTTQQLEYESAASRAHLAGMV